MGTTPEAGATIPSVTSAPHVSVVIPTYNRLARLRRVLAAFEAQTCPFELFEVVVVSDGSTDGTDEYLASAHPPFDLVVASQANAGPAVARNRGVQLARAPLVLFVDDDVVPTPTLVAQHLASHDVSGDADAVVIGPMCTPPDFSMQPWVAWEQSMLYKQYDAMTTGMMAPTSRQFYTGNASVRRARLIEAGGFDTRFRRAEDVELSYRLGRVGVRFVWNPDAVGYHYADRSFDSWLQTAVDYGRNDVVFSRDHGQDPTFRRARAEWRGRNRLTKSVVRACLRWPLLESRSARFVRALAVHAPSHSLGAVSRLALSVLYNVAFYRGFAAALGGAGEFGRLIERRDRGTSQDTARVDGQLP